MMIIVHHTFAHDALGSIERVDFSNPTEHLQLVRTLRGGSHASTRVFATPNGQRFVRKTALSPFTTKLRSQCLWLRERQGLPYVPKLLREAGDGSTYSFDLEYLDAYQPFYDFIHTHPIADSYRILDGILHAVQFQIHRAPMQRYAPEITRRYISEKIIDKIGAVAHINRQIHHLTSYETIVVNGVTYPNLPDLAAQLLEHRAALHQLATIEECPLHGDLTIDNIVVHGDQFVLLDPNDENAISDPVVDFAKLYQSLHSGYEFLCQLEHVAVHDNRIEFVEQRSAPYSDLFAYLQDRLALRFTPQRRDTIPFHESVHYCRMLPYRAVIQPHTVAAFYGVAVRLMAQFLGASTQPQALTLARARASSSGVPKDR